LEVDVQQGNFKILRLLPPSRSETEKIGQKTKGILGVKAGYPHQTNQECSVLHLLRTTYDLMHPIVFVNSGGF
jgi:hypothetical protein